MRRWAGFCLLFEVSTYKRIIMNQVTTGDWSAEDMEMLSKTLKAIAHPTRLAIIDMLEKEEKLTVTEIYTRLNADQSSVSHHLSVLRRRGVVGQERQGKFIYYFLLEKSYLTLLDCLSDIQRSVVTYS